MERVVPFDPVIAATRFGTGRSPVLPDPDSIDAMLDRLAGPDRSAERWRIGDFTDIRPHLHDFRQAGRARNQARGTSDEAALEAAYRALRDRALAISEDGFVHTLLRGLTAEDGFRERLSRFWADHFTVVSKRGVTRHLVTPYVEEAIRPHLTARFADMLKAAATHPMMLDYLDQIRSMGPGSAAARRRNRGLNENLAREVLELHTLGVGGPYDQTDVRQFAELLTGLSYDPRDGFTFRADFAEPGAEIVLGRSYGGAAPSLDDVLLALDDIAVHPATARHLAEKLAVHFVADRPDPALVAALEARYVATGGDLMAVYGALLSHPASWVAGPGKVMPPFAFVCGSLRALAVPPRRLTRLDTRDLRSVLLRPLRNMGQAWEQPLGPDGWPEAAEAWITPQGMAARMTWALDAPERLLDDLPDPRDFVTTALGPGAPEPVVFAAGAAESRADGIGVVLASAAFQRR